MKFRWFALHVYTWCNGGTPHENSNDKNFKGTEFHFTLIRIWYLVIQYSVGTRNSNGRTQTANFNFPTLSLKRKSKNLFLIQILLSYETIALFARKKNFWIRCYQQTICCYENRNFSFLFKRRKNKDNLISEQRIRCHFKVVRMLSGEYLARFALL